MTEAEQQARKVCWAACRQGERPEQKGQSYTRCCDPRVCHDWEKYVIKKGGTDG